MKQSRRRIVWNEVRRLFLLLLGVIISALAFSLFQVPFNLAAGGISGLGIIVAHFTGFSAAIFFFIANVPLLLLGWFMLGGWRFLYRTIIAVFVFTVVTGSASSVLPTYLAQWPITDNILLSAIYAGMVGGVGGGLIFGAGGTLGGTAIIGRIIQERTGMPLSQIYLFVDGAIVITAGFVWLGVGALCLSHAVAERPGHRLRAGERHQPHAHSHHHYNKARCPDPGHSGAVGARCKLLGGIWRLHTQGRARCCFAPSTASN